MYLNKRKGILNGTKILHFGFRQGNHFKVSPAVEMLSFPGPPPNCSEKYNLM